MFEKSEKHFPVKTRRIDLNHCGIAPMYSGAAEAVCAFQDGRVREGVLGADGYGRILQNLRSATAKLMQTDADNVSFMKNAAEGLSLIAFGYPFEAGDEVISYVHEYPSNHYPWLLQQRRGVKIKLLPNVDLNGRSAPQRPLAWSMADLESLVTDRTRVVAISHVQFTSGYAADLAELGEFCHSKGIDLVVDAAQSMGCLPVLPEQWHVAAAVASGWKWMMGPIGCGLFFTSPALRSKLSIVMAGGDIVTQGDDYLDHTWSPYTDGRMFEYSTVQIAMAAGMSRGLRDIFTAYGPERIRDEVFRLQDVFLANLKNDGLRPVIWPSNHRSGILSLACDEAEAVSKRAIGKGLTVTSRGGYLRVAPHFYNDDEQLVQAARLLSELA